MSTFDTKSKIIGNRDASPIVLTDSAESIGRVHECIGVQQTGAAIIDAGTTIRLVTVPSNARLSALDYSSDTIGSSSLDVAVWYPTFVPQGAGPGLTASQAGTLISSSAFATAVAGVDTTTEWTDALGDLSAYSIQNRSKALWEVLGLAADPQLDLDVGFTVRTASAEQGYVGLRAKYVD